MSGAPPPPTEPPAEAAPSGVSAPAGTPRVYDRVPPHSLEAEVSVLGAALLSKNAASDVTEVLRPEDFYRNAHRLVFEGVLALTHAGDVADTVTITDWLSRQGRLDEVGGAAAVYDLTVAVPTAANAAYYARIVRQRALLRRLIDVGTEVVKLGYDGSDDAETIVDRAESMVYEVAQTGSVSDYAKLGDLLTDSFEQIEKLADQRSEVTGLPTGYNDFDRLTAGLQPQNLVIIAARPAMGKSSLALGLAHYVTAKIGRPSIMFSLEMSKLEIVNRLLSAEARIDSSKLRTGRLDDADWLKLGDALGTLSEAPLFIDDTPSITLNEIRAKCRRLKAKHGLDLVIVDYLQLMQSHRRVDNRQQEVAEISRGLKMLAKEMDAPVIALSQLSRQPESRTDKRPMLADLRESGCLTRETRLFRADNGLPITFGELLDGAMTDVPVWSSDDRGRLVPGRLTHAFPSGRKPVYRVRLRSGLTVEASGNHPFRTLHGWVALDDLEVGSHVAAARLFPDPSDPQPMDPDEIVLLAHLIGEGTIVARQPIHYTSADAGNLDAVEKAAWNRFGVTARRVRDDRSTSTTQLHLPAPFQLTNGRRNPIAAWLDELGIWDRRSYDKHLPSRVFSLPTDQLRAFVSHLWATDGCLHVRPDGRRGPKVSLYYGTSSQRLAQDLSLLLRRVGILARIREIDDHGHRTGYQVWIHGAEQQRRFLTDIGIHGEGSSRIPSALAALEERASNPNIDVLPKEVWGLVRQARAEQGMTEREFQTAIQTADGGSSLYRAAPSRTRLARVATILSEPVLEQLASDDLTWDEIVEIEPLGEREVFDATVDEHHSFVAEGLVLHNSIEQDADIVGFIYRDEVYDQDSPDKGIAELIIAKHRNGATGIVKLAFLDHLTTFANLARNVTGGGGSNGSGRPPTPV